MLAMSGSNVGHIIASSICRPWSCGTHLGLPSWPSRSLAGSCELCHLKLVPRFVMDAAQEYLKAEPSFFASSVGRMQQLFALQCLQAQLLPQEEFAQGLTQTLSTASES